MSLEIKRQAVITQLRKENHQNYFRKIRLSLRSQQDSKKSSKSIRGTAEGQDEILQAIKAYKKQYQPLNFSAINQYILACDYPFSEQFTLEVANIVLQDNRKNGHAVAALAHLLSKYDEAVFLSRVYQIVEMVELLLKQNSNQELQTMNNARAIAYLIFNVLRLCENKQEFYFITRYYNIIANSVGYFDRTLIILIEISSHFRELLPEDSFIYKMLGTSLQYNQLDPIDIKIVCQFLENCVCFGLSEELNGILSKWLELRLKQKKFPFSLKQNLIKIFTIMIGSAQVTSLINNQNQFFTLIQEIIGIARFGNINCKPTALICLTKLAIICNKKQIQYYVQNTQILETLIYALELPLEHQQTFKILQSIAGIIQIKHHYLKLAYNLGFTNQLYRLSNLKIMKISEIANLILEIYNNG